MNEKNVRKRFINLPIAYATISISGWIYYYLAEAITLFISKIYFDITIKNILLVSSMYIILECLFSFTLGFFIMETLHRKIFLPRFFPDGKIAATPGLIKPSNNFLFTVFYISVSVFPICFISFAYFSSISSKLNESDIRFIVFFIIILLLDIVILITFQQYYSSPLKKLLITGNGKCNYFNESFDISFYHSNNQELLSKFINDTNKALALDFFQSIGIVPRIKDGYYYPYSNQAITVKNALLKEAENRNIKLITDCYVKEIIRKNGSFHIHTNNEDYTCDYLIISAGSKAYPKTGSDGSGYYLAGKLGHTINKVMPSLVGLKSNDKFIKELSGIRCNGLLSIDETDEKEYGQIQFTNYGLSGICAFNLSSMINYMFENKKEIYIKINYLYDLGIYDLESAHYLLNELNNRANNRTISDLLDSLLDYKITNVILKKLNIDKEKKYNDLNKKEIKSILEHLISFKVSIIDTNSFDAAQVCKGGISLKEINTDTFESKIIPNLYFTGEIIDVDGKCGGYNIAFATISAILAGKDIAND